MYFALVRSKLLLSLPAVCPMAVQVVKRLSFGDMSLHLPEHLQTQQVLHALNEPSAENFKR